MPTYVMIGRDGPDGLSLREQNHEAHVAHVSALDEQGRIRIAGPIREDEGERSIGAVIIFDADSRKDAERFVNNDPYVRAGVFEIVTVDRFVQYIPQTS